MTLSLKVWQQLAGRIILLATVSLATACGGGSSSVTISSASDDRDPSIARQWNEMLLDAIRGDFARPTIHARNLFHISAAMYDAWAAYSDDSSPYLLGNTVGDFPCDLGAFEMPQNVHLAREEAISYAAYRLIRYRFRLSPGVLETEEEADALLVELGYDEDFDSTDYAEGSPAALGNYIASCYIAYGRQDGSNEAGFYANEYYVPVNDDLNPRRPGNPAALLPEFDLDRWQPLALDSFIDQSGNKIDTKIEFLSPEWGQVESFALGDAPKTTYQRDGFDYQVYYDPGSPPSYLSEEYKWGYSLVSIWSSHLDPSQGRGADMIDISPASLGSEQNAYLPFEMPPPDNYYPATSSVADYGEFYDLFNGGDASTGYPNGNPYTGLPYETQMVPLGDYTRVLAEFWADGPESETPPGHWFVILNEEVSDDPAFVKRFEGIGPELGPLEWDVKTYFALGGTMHDAAIAAWGIKGWYDYIRPVSAIRAMAEFGQSTDDSLTGTNYDERGIPLYPGYIEQIVPTDPVALRGANDENLGEIKILAWRGPEKAGAGWILAKEWWPYQRPTFVTPPFAGYVSGHSTYSRAAAELLTAMTGDAYFPGGMSGFEVTANEFLVFEEGPSVDMTLEWATYRDASDQCSLSRIWGGIHPPVDDMPGRFIGREIGLAGFKLSKGYFEGNP